MIGRPLYFVGINTIAKHPLAPRQDDGRDYSCHISVGRTRRHRSGLIRQLLGHHDGNDACDAAGRHELLPRPKLPGEGSIHEVIAGVMPFLLAMVALILIISLFPGLAL